MKIDVSFTIAFLKETDGRTIASIPEMPGLHVYGVTKAEAAKRAHVTALQIMADRIEHDEDPMVGSAGSTGTKAKGCGKPLYVQWVGKPTIKCGGKSGLCVECREARAAPVKLAVRKANAARKREKHRKLTRTR